MFFASQINKRLFHASLAVAVAAAAAGPTFLALLLQFGDWHCALAIAFAKTIKNILRSSFAFHYLAMHCSMSYLCTLLFYCIGTAWHHHTLQRERRDKVGCFWQVGSLTSLASWMKIDFPLPPAFSSDESLVI